jgi:hypothetical protein
MSSRLKDIAALFKLEECFDEDFILFAEEELSVLNIKSQITFFIDEKI